MALWDEHDPEIDAVLARRLAKQAPFEAIRGSFVETLAGRYDADLDFQLRRVKFIYATEALHAAAVEADFKARAELTEGVRQFLSGGNTAAAPIIAGAAMLALDVALDEWQRHSAKRSLASCLTVSFDHLANLGALE